MDDNQDWLEIPDFLRRKETPPDPEPQGPRKDVTSMVARQDDTTAEAADDTPALAPSKPAHKANGHRKPPRAAKAKAATTKAAKAKAKGAKPAKRVKAEQDAFGYRKGSMKSQAAAIYAAKKGATLAEVKAKLGSVQLNVLTELESKGHKIKRVKEAGDGSRQVTRYFLQG